MIKGVFFDLGGTLFSYKNVTRTTFPILVEAIERAGTTRENNQIKLAYKEASREVAKDYSIKKYYLHKTFFNEVFESFLERLKIDFGPDLLSWYTDHHRQEMIKCLEIKKDCLSTLQKLKEKEIYLSIVSNIDEDMLNPLIDKGNLKPIIDDAISSEKAQSCKPDKKIFELALKRSGLNARDSLFVGDSPEHDIAGASPMGFTTVLVLDGGLEPPLQIGKKTLTADHTIASLEELNSIV
tara:strand:+ start:386 stop:1102 length:717 start_codon:yes stop_codon:yes gene_type:complete